MTTHISVIFAAIITVAAIAIPMTYYHVTTEPSPSDAEELSIESETDEEEMDVSYVASDSLKEAMIDCYYMQNYQSADFERSDIRIDSFVCTIDGCSFAYFFNSKAEYTEEPHSVNIGEYRLTFANSREPLVYKDGELKTLLDAYNSNWYDNQVLMFLGGLVCANLEIINL